MNVYVGGPIVISDMQGPCDSGFHIPTKDEWNTVITQWTALSVDNTMSYYLKLPEDGYLWRPTPSKSGDGYGNYWCSDLQSEGRGYNLGTNGGSKYISNNPISAGLHIRAFKNTPVEPDSGWTALYSDKIYHNSTLGLISIKNGTDWITIADKNLGATTVWNSGDTATQDNSGNFYQWGNNYGFPFSGSVTTSGTQVNAQNYGPNNYYSSSTFINGAYNWDSSNNANLRGGVSQGSTTNYVELKNAYIGEAPYEGNELCFTANTAGSTIQLTKNNSPTAVTLETSTDGENWATYTIGTTITLANIGDKVYFRNTSTTDTGFGINGSNYYRFVMTGSISGSGDINYLLNKNSTTTVSSYCYYNLFYGCTSLIEAPQLPATTLATNCYYQMFYGCTGLITAPSLPATTLADYCYYNMFRECSNLTTAPALPATTLASNCYNAMFRLCTSLTTVPSLPVTTLATYCYAYMFFGCTGLTALPALPATTLADYCYMYMFQNCSKIKISETQTGEYQTAYRIPKAGTGTYGTGSLVNMFNYTGGTFTNNPSINTTYYTSNTVV